MKLKLLWLKLFEFVVIYEKFEPGYFTTSPEQKIFNGVLQNHMFTQQETTEM